jgi:hypothetical protein
VTVKVLIGRHILNFLHDPGAPFNSQSHDIISVTEAEIGYWTLAAIRSAARVDEPQLPHSCPRMTARARILAPVPERGEDVLMHLTVSQPFPSPLFLHIRLAVGGIPLPPYIRRQTGRENHAD